jgi:hypothetical protein
MADPDAGKGGAELTRTEQALQKALGTALYPLGVTVHNGELETAATEAHYLIFTVEEIYTSWANNLPLLGAVDVELRYYARRPPCAPEHLRRIHEIMRGLGYREDGLPVDTPRLNRTDYAGKIMTYHGIEVISNE